MLIGIYGPHAVGKTTFIYNSMDALADAIPRPLQLVCADNPVEFELCGETWVERRRQAWKLDRPAKLPLIETAMFDKAIWIVESARFFSGFGPDITGFIKLGGAAKFIIPTVSPALMRSFIQERCAHNGRAFNEPYWDEARLRYESHDRYVNFIKAHMLPLKIDCAVFEIAADRQAWDKVFNQIVTWLC